MAKIRVFAFLSTIVIVGVAAYFFSFYARGYRFDPKTFKFQPNGILVIKSEPDGASVYINNELKTATNTTLSLSPGTYDVEVKKDGYFTWYKRMTIQKEIVTSADVSLFKNVPSLSPETFSGAANPVISDDGTKIAFMVLPTKDADTDKIGLWTMDTVSLPLGFSQSPKRITDGDLTGATYIFSPDTRQILLTTSNGIFLLDTGSFTAQAQRVNILSKKDSTLATWQSEINTKNQSLVRSLPPTLSDVLTRKAKAYIFSPDEQMILYTATSEANIPSNLITPLPGSSTQKEERNLVSGHTYVYDTKEDRNFLVTDQDVAIDSEEVFNGTPSATLRFMPTSRHLILSEPGRITIMDYDGTNRQIVYSGSYISPFAFPFSNTTKILILTNLGAGSSSPNLYTLTVK